MRAKILVGKPEEMRPLGKVNVDRRITSIWFVEKYDMGL
jgi:hypothetical protein